MGPDGVQTQAFIDGAGADIAEGAYASVAGLAPENYTMLAKVPHRLRSQIWQTD